MDMADCSRTVFVKSSEEVDEVIKGFEYETSSKFITYKKAKSFGFAAKGNFIYSHS